MPRFFIDSWSGEAITITGADAKHILKSLRMSVGDNIALCDQKGFDYHCKITGVLPGEVEVTLEEKVENQSELAVEVVLYQALPKGDKLELIVQKSVELGVSRIVPVVTSRCISRPKEEAMSRKITRLEAVALEAAKQSGRGKIPTIGRLLTFEKAIEEMNKSEKSVLFYENATAKLSDTLTPMVKTLAIMVGSEGGFSREEVSLAENSGVAVCSLGRRILRCETAPIVALSAIGLLAGEY